MGLLAVLGLPELAKANPAKAHPDKRGAPARPKPAKTGKPPPKLGVDQYIALLNGTVQLLADEQQLGSINVDPSDPKDLVAAHRDMLLRLQHALHWVKDSPVEALDLWDKVRSQIAGELGKAVDAGLESGKIAGPLRQLAEAEKERFVPAAYWAAKHKAEGESKLEAPDAAQMAGKFTQAEAELKDADRLFKESLKLTSGLGNLAGLSQPAEVKKIVDLVMTPGTIVEKLEQARKNGIATTAVELVVQVSKATGTLVKTVGQVGTKVIEARKALALANGATKVATDAVKQLEGVAANFQKLVKAGEMIGKAASYAAVIADGFKLVSAVYHGDWSKALSAGKDLAFDAAPLLLGAEVAGPLTVVVGVVQAELEAIRLAAGILRSAKVATVSLAALDFVEQCNVVAKPARSLVADCDLMLDESKPPGVREVAERKANGQAATVSNAIRELSSHVSRKSKDAIGGHPELVEALGREAIAAMNLDWGDNALLVRNQIQDVFHGANQMARFVGEKYKN